MNFDFSSHRFEGCAGGAHTSERNQELPGLNDSICNGLAFGFYFTDRGLPLFATGPATKHKHGPST